ncbi:MAG: hypothetical protein EP330_08770 [Deltaproteobacteria bacterium]|nr:MAG: hypothetical protein EP330_08770 [Deltaproteobacteria bacterium]
MTELHIDASPSEVRARIQGALHTTDGLWFNTGDARRAWVAASSPLFVQWLGPDRARIGPRLGSPDVSRFCPLYRIELVPVASGTTVHFAASLDPITAVLGVFWSIMLVLGGVFIVGQIQAGEVAPGAIGWWLFLVVAAATVAVVSAVQGGRTLTAADAWFEQVLRTPAVEEEWV